MKYFLLLSLIFTLSACTSSEMRTTQSPVAQTPVSSEAKIDPYEIGSVDTAFKILGPDHKIEVG